MSRSEHPGYRDSRRARCAAENATQRPIRGLCALIAGVLLVCAAVPAHADDRPMPPIEQGIGNVVAYLGAVRLANPYQETLPGTTTTILLAPTGLTGCAEAQWYRINAGLPAKFDRLVVRESNCIQRDDVRTWCCYGWWQLYVSLHLADPKLGPRYALCGVSSAADVNSDTPLDKWRQACAAKAVNDVQPGAWS